MPCSLAIEGYVDVQMVESAGGCRRPILGPKVKESYRWQQELLGPKCSFFGRKFPAKTALAMQELVTQGTSAKALRIVISVNTDPL